MALPRQLEGLAGFARTFALSETDLSLAQNRQHFLAGSLELSCLLCILAHDVAESIKICFRRLIRLQLLCKAAMEKGQWQILSCEVQGSVEVPLFQTVNFCMEEGPVISFRSVFFTPQAPHVRTLKKMVPSTAHGPVPPVTIDIASLPAVDYASSSMARWKARVRSQSSQVYSTLNQIERDKALQGSTALC